MRGRFETCPSREGIGDGAMTAWEGEGGSRTAPTRVGEGTCGLFFW